MDNTDKNKRVILRKRKRNPDGSVTVTTKVKQRKKKKVVIARGTGEKTVGNIIASQLQPFKSAMIEGLKRHGYNTWNVPFPEIISLYYNEFVSNQDKKENSFVPINRYEFRNNPAWKIRPSDNVIGDLDETRNREYFTQIDTIVNNIISIFAEAKKTKENAIMNNVDPKSIMTADELQQAKAGQKVERDLENKMLYNNPVRWGSVLKIGFWVFVFYAISKI